MRINSGLALNTSATFSPVGNDIAFVGSVRGNPDIYLIKDDGTNLRRLTTTTRSSRRRSGARTAARSRSPRDAAARRRSTSWTPRGRTSGASRSMATGMTTPCSRRTARRSRTPRASTALPDPHRQPDHRREPHHRRRRLERTADLVTGRPMDRVSVRIAESASGRSTGCAPTAPTCCSSRSMARTKNPTGPRNRNSRRSAVGGRQWKKPLLLPTADCRPPTDIIVKGVEQQ
jgi:hypothetical protein